MEVKIDPAHRARGSRTLGGRTMPRKTYTLDEVKAAVLAYMRDATRHQLRSAWCKDKATWDGYAWCYSAIHGCVRMPDGEQLGDSGIKRAVLALVEDGTCVSPGKVGATGWRLSPVEMAALRAEVGA